MFFILDEERRIDIIRDKGRNITYQVLDVIMPKKQTLSATMIQSSSSDSSEENSEKWESFLDLN